MWFVHKIPEDVNSYKLEAQTKNALVSNLDDIIERKDQLHSLTGCTPEEFKWILIRFTEYVESLEGDDARRFHRTYKWSRAREQISGQACTISYTDTPALQYKARASCCNTQDSGQSNICRYIQFTKQGLIKILPTADTVAKAIDLMRMIDRNSPCCFKLGCILWHTIRQAWTMLMAPASTNVCRDYKCRVVGWPDLDDVYHEWAKWLPQNPLI